MHSEGTDHLTCPRGAACPTRVYLRDFLRFVPRSEGKIVAHVPTHAGTVVDVTRTQLAARIDLMRVRMREIVRLKVEEGWTRDAVCKRFNHISITTVERDLAEAFDLLEEWLSKNEGSDRS